MDMLEVLDDDVVGNGDKDSWDVQVVSAAVEDGVEEFDTFDSGDVAAMDCVIVGDSGPEPDNVKADARLAVSLETVVVRISETTELTTIVA
jgi:hypothetical protein